MPQMKAAWVVVLLCCSAAALPVLGQEAAETAQATASGAEAAADTSADAAAEAALATLNSEMKQAEEEQLMGDDHKTDVISKIIEDVAPGLLASGDGDVSTTGEAARARDYRLARCSTRPSNVAECLEHASDRPQGPARTTLPTSAP